MTHFLTPYSVLVTPVFVDAVWRPRVTHFFDALWRACDTHFRWRPLASMCHPFFDALWRPCGTHFFDALGSSMRRPFPLTPKGVNMFLSVWHFDALGRASVTHFC